MSWIPYTSLNAQSPAQKITPALILFPQYLADQPFRVTPLSSGECAFRLMQVLVNARNLPNHGLRSTTQLASNAQAAALIYSDGQDAVRWIQRWCDE